MNQKEVRIIIALCLVGDIQDATVFNSRIAHRDLSQNPNEADTTTDESESEFHTPGQSKKDTTGRRKRGRCTICGRHTIHFCMSTKYNAEDPT
jgi:hypothetical protein